MDTSQKDEKYNGWTNYHTWNIALLLDSDYRLYRRMGVILEYLNDQSTLELVSGHLVREFFLAALDRRSPSLRDAPALQETVEIVNWDEIAVTLQVRQNEMRRGEVEVKPLCIGQNTFAV